GSWAGWEGRPGAGCGRPSQPAQLPQGQSCRHVAGRGVDVAIEFKLQSDVCGAEAARRSHLRDAGDAAELALERRGDGRSHGYRAGSRQVRANRDGRKIHLRKRRDGQEAESDDAGKQNGDGDQRRSYRPSDKGRREIGRDMQVFHLISGRRLLNGIADVKLEAAAKPVKSEVDDRGGIEGQQLAENQAANDGDAEWTAQLGTDAGS